MIVRRIIFKNKNKLIGPTYVVIDINSTWNFLACHYICKIFINGILLLYQWALKLKHSLLFLFVFYRLCLLLVLWNNKRSWASSKLSNFNYFSHTNIVLWTYIFLMIRKVKMKLLLEENKYLLLLLDLRSNSCQASCEMPFAHKNTLRAWEVDWDFVHAQSLRTGMQMSLGQACSTAVNSNKQIDVDICKMNIFCLYWVIMP